MRTYSELISYFTTKSAVEKQKWIDNLPIAELKILRDGSGKLPGTWSEYINLTISLKIEKEREDKLNELGI